MTGGASSLGLGSTIWGWGAGMGAEKKGDGGSGLALWVLRYEMKEECTSGVISVRVVWTGTGVDETVNGGQGRESIEMA